VEPGQPKKKKNQVSEGHTGEHEEMAHPAQGILSVCVAVSLCSKEGPLTWRGDSKEGDASGSMAMGMGTAVRETQEDATGQDMERNPATERNSPLVVLVEMVRHRQRSSGGTGQAMERK